MTEIEIVKTGCKITAIIEKIRSHMETDGLSGFSLMHTHCKDSGSMDSDWEKYQKIVIECMKILDEEE